MTKVSSNDDYFETGFKTVLNRIGTLQNAAQIAGVTAEQVAKWRDGKAKPPFKAVASLANVAGVSLDWLATGEGAREKDSLDEMTKNIRIDADLMAELVKIVNEYLDSLDRELPPEKLGKVYAYLYNYCHKDEPVSRDNIISLIDLAG